MCRTHAVTQSDPSAQIELRDAMLTEPDVQHPIRLGGVQPHRIPGEGLRDPQGALLEIELPALVDLAHRHPARVRDRRERGREGAQARLVPGGRTRQGERVMRRSVL